MKQPAQTPETEASLPPMNLATVRPGRLVWGMLGLATLTLGSLGLAWLFPDSTMLHFLWVAQAVPVFYLLLVWWGTQQTTHQVDDAS